MIFLSYVLDESTPTYGNRNKFKQIKNSDISKGDVANDTFISSTVHIGTHIDMPFHFYENGQTIKDFDANFWIFSRPLVIEVQQDDLIINENLKEQLNKIDDDIFDILIVKTGICYVRDEDKYWSDNFGFHPDVYDYIRTKFPSVRVIGFDSISVSSFSNRMLGREAHRKFLNPKDPILLLEDMDLRNIDKHTRLSKIILSPLRISNCDGLPCTIFGEVND